VLRPYHETKLHHIAEELREALAQSEGRLRSADHIARWFAPAVIALAAAVWVARLVVHGWPYAISAAGWFPSVAVLAVACPCAFGLAGISAVTAATGSLLGRGFLVKGLAQLEQLHRVQTIVFDKTGTLTEGRIGIEALVWRDEPRPRALELLLALEAHAVHPIAQAVRAWLVDRGVQSTMAPGLVEDLSGQGRRLDGGADGSEAGRVFAAGAASLWREPFVPLQAAPHHTLVWFGWDGDAEGCLLLTDPVAAGARETVAGLQAQGRRVELLSGDRQQVCDHLRRELGVDAARGDATLEAKVELIRARVAAGERIAFVGDGTNDALAMSEATASVAVGGATDEALAAAGLVMLHRRLPALVELFARAAALGRVIRGNYIWAFSFNTLFLPVAAMGLLQPLAAMLLMLLSSSGVLLNSLRLRESSANTAANTSANGNADADANADVNADVAADDPRR
jgi:cation transport ATPase